MGMFSFPDSWLTPTQLKARKLAEKQAEKAKRANEKRAVKQSAPTWQITETPKQPRYVPIELWNTTTGQPWPSNEHEWRYLLRERETNGLDACVIRIGRRLLIDETAFLAWLATHRERVKK